MHAEHDRDVGEQAERRELQDSGILAVVEEDLEQHAKQAEAERVGDNFAAQEHLHDGAHRAQVGAEIDDVGEEQERDRRPQERLGVVPPEVGGDTSSCDGTDLRRDVLDDGHERQAEQQAPRQAIAELSANLAVGADAAWIVVGRSGDEPGPSRARNDLLLQPNARSRCYGNITILNRRVP